MRRALLTVLGAIGLLVGCGDSASPPMAPLPQFSVEGDCQMDAVTCGHILAGIQYLKNHPHGQCNQLGAAAEARYNASSESGMGFRPGTVPNADMGVNMHETPGVTFSGWSPSDGIIMVTNQFVNSPNAGNEASTGGLIAHEEGGHMTGEDSPEHNTGFGEIYQDLCQRRTME